jgi:phosphoglycolate phosphatase
MMKMKTQGIVFDLDGTLLNSLADIANAGNTVLAAHGFPVHSIDDYRLFVGDGVRRLVHRLVPPATADDPALLATLLREYAEQYARTWNVESRLYDGITDLLDALVQRDVRLGVLSNKPQAATCRCVEYYLGRYPFAAVLGQQADRPPKPDPTGVREILARLQVGADACCYVGDSAVDMQTALSADLFAVGAAWGFRSVDELRDAGAQAIIHHPRELLTLLGT